MGVTISSHPSEASSSGALSPTTYQLYGEVWLPAGETVSGYGVLQFLQQMYLQKLGAGPSCRTNSSNGGCPRRP
nr:unnamed protein product [Digitaria exilis]